MGPSQYDTMARKVWEKLPTLYQKLYIITVNMWLSIETLRYLNSQNFPRNLTNIPADFKKLCCTSWTCLTLQTIKFLVECVLDVFISIVFFFFFFYVENCYLFMLSVCISLRSSSYICVIWHRCMLMVRAHGLTHVRTLKIRFD